MNTARCRVCLSESDCVRNIYTGRCLNGQSYAEALASCIDGITIDRNVTFPSLICETCISRLESWIVCGKIDDEFVSNCVSSVRAVAGAGTKTDSDEGRRTKASVDKDNRIETEEIHIKTETNDEYFRPVSNGDGTFPLVEKPCECGYCGKTFGQKSTLTRHLRTHTGERPYECDRCEKTFGERRILRQHLRTHTDERPYECDRCGNAFRQLSALTKHSRTHTGERPYECDRCEKAFGDKSTLTRHLLMHTGERPYECNRCGNSFRQSSSLIRHLRTHTGERPYECDRCKKAFGNKSTLTRHLLTHAGEKPYECDRCGKAFCQSSALTKHSRTHTGERPYECDRCKKTFGNKSILTRHLLTHADEKPYECDLCGKTFRQKYNLVLHSQTHAVDESRCDQCEKVFRNRSSLKRHSRVHVHENEFDRIVSDSQPSNMFTDRLPSPEQEDAERTDEIIETAAIKTENACVKMEPDDEYFRKETDPLEIKPFEHGLRKVST